MWVATREDEDLSENERLFFRTRFEENYPGHTIIGPPTKSYNCHGYSHSVFQNGDTCNICWYQEILNDCFVQVQTPLQGDIAVVRDYTDATHTSFELWSQHSSIVVNQDTLISKWGENVLTKHHKNDVISLSGLTTGMSVYTYYRRVINTQLTGPDIIDGSGTYIFTPTPNINMTSCTWSVEPADMFQTSSGTGYTANLTYKTPPTSPIRPPSPIWLPRLGSPLHFPIPATTIIPSRRKSTCSFPPQPFREPPFPTGSSSTPTP